MTLRQKELNYHEVNNALLRITLEICLKMEKGQNNYSTFLRQGGENGNQVIFNGYRLEALIPKSIFDLGLSSIVGSRLETIGIFKFRVKEREGGRFETFSFKTPNQIVINFDDTTTIKEINGKLVENDDTP